MYERILVALDGSRFSEEVIPYAVALAARGAPLTLLRVVDKAADESDARAYVENLGVAHGERGQCVLTSGDVAEAILEQARAVPETLVVMTTHGHSGLLEAMVGSVALRVVRGSAGALVLVSRPTGAAPPTAPGIRNVVLPLDGTELSEAMAPHAAQLAKQLGAELVVVNVVNPATTARGEKPDSDAMKGLETGYVRASARDLAARYEVATTWEVLHGDPAAAIADFVRGRPDAILAMVTRGRTALQSALLGSVTTGCLRQAGVPVLVRVP